MPAQTYEGSCHCQKVRYRVTADLTQLYSCNCSICSRTGALMAFVPASSFELLAGEDALTDYQFAKQNVHHLFCSTCGIRSFGRGKRPDGADMTMLNVRCLEGVDVDAIEVKRVDGKSL